MERTDQDHRYQQRSHTLDRTLRHVQHTSGLLGKSTTPMSRKIPRTRRERRTMSEKLIPCQHDTTRRMHSTLPREWHTRTPTKLVQYLLGSNTLSPREYQLLMLPHRNPSDQCFRHSANGRITRHPHTQHLCYQNRIP